MTRVYIQIDYWGPTGSHLSELVTGMPGGSWLGQPRPSCPLLESGGELRPIYLKVSALSLEVSAGRFQSVSRGSTYRLSIRA